MNKKSLAWVLVATILVTGIAFVVAGRKADLAWFSAGRIADVGTVNWANHGLTPDEARHSQLQQINTDTVSGLGLQWSLDLADEHSLEATPLAVDGVLYFTGGMGMVYAVEAETGRVRWRFDPKVGEAIPIGRRNMIPVNRGLAYADGAVYLATRDGRMIAIDTASGKPRWIRQFLRSGDLATSTGAPRICAGKVVIGNSGAENAARGYVTALDAKSGDFAWRFFTVPGNPDVDHDETTEIASKTWSGEWWKYGGGGTAWNALTCDNELGQLLIGTGNAGPYAIEMRSSGHQDNLFVASVVAVDIKSGRYKWHYQYNPAEVWDWKATMDIVTTSLTIGGKSRKVLLQAPSNGFFYVVDRTNGKLISAEKYGKVNWADRIDLASGRPVERREARYWDKPFTLYPGLLGAHNWPAMSFDPDLGLVYIPYIQQGATFERSAAERQTVRNPIKKDAMRTGVISYPTVDPKDPLDGRGSLIAWNVLKQKIEWRVDHPSSWNGGTLATAGRLVFQGMETGEFSAFDSQSGRRLWTFDAKLGIMAPPITFAYKNKQYVSVLVGYGGSGGYGGPEVRKQMWIYGAQPRRLLTFALGGTAKLPQTPARQSQPMPIDDPKLVLEQTKVEKGALLFGPMCSGCHNMADGAGAAPDLLGSSLAADRASFGAFVVSGARASAGMPKFTDLDQTELDELYHFIRGVARERAAQGGANAKAPTDNRVRGGGI